MNHSCTCAAIVLICLSLFGCSKSPEPIDTAASGNRTAELWRFLNSFVGTDTVPTVAEIEEKFGKPDEPVEAESVMTMSAKKVMEQQDKLKDAPPGFRKPRYYCFTAEEVAADAWVELVQHIYNHGAESWTRYIEICVRPADNTVAGWQWNENVPPGQEIGPPK
jgi:hypothetical protein